MLSLKNKKKKQGVWLAAALFACCTIVSAAESSDEYEPGFYANVEVDLGYDDNVRRLDVDRRSSMFMRIRPALEMLTVSGTKSFALNYEGDYAWFFSESNENYFDHFVQARANIEWTRKFSTNFDLGFRAATDIRRNTTVFEKHRDEWREWGGLARGVYGRRIAKMQLQVEGSYWRREYVNNEQGFRDRNTGKIAGTVFWNLGPKTQLLVELDYESVRYDHDWLYGGTIPVYRLDSNEWRLLVGTTWLATAKTSGVFKIGYFKRNLKDDYFADQSGLAFDLSMTWKPKTYSIVDVYASRGTEETYQDYTADILRTVVGIDWRHGLTSRTYLTLGGEYEKDQFQDGGRDDDYWEASIGIDHSLTRGTNLGLEYMHANRDSSEPGLGYSVNVIMLSVSSKVF